MTTVPLRAADGKEGCDGVDQEIDGPIFPVPLGEKAVVACPYGSCAPGAGDTGDVRPEQCGRAVCLRAFLESGRHEK